MRSGASVPAILARPHRDRFLLPFSSCY